MFFVDREKIEETLVFLEGQIKLFKEHDKWETEIEKAALERVVHTIIESVLDVGNMMIDGFIMRDPGSYEDIVEILVDEKVVSSGTGDSLKVLVGQRRQVVQAYTSVDHALLQEVFTKEMVAVEDFPGCTRKYLANELGPVSAFKK
ncbi:DUF86 domain-containing protein [Mesobacillus zeae]|uniref:DUF86 domain-containing protein n=1 Tax=Mesobacillus zeae TaxID=1917180 RepID=A0A398BGN0_9BACI|nr:DUF86 domain-containing protein [Mesobacillus zeae]RID88887.1 DUF86 domain-containing protein [Mesobacillus zeae]